MNRSLLPNPKAAEYSIMQLQLAPGSETPDWDKLGLRNTPSGYKPFVRYVDNMITIGIEPMGAKVENPKDSYESMSEAELRTQCGIKGIPYTEQTKRTEMVGALRAKGKA